MDLTGRRALITGGSRGLGRAIAGALAARGADVVIASRKLDACAAAAREIAAAHGVDATPLAVNVGDWAQCDALAEAAGPVDILVNNAGLSPLYPSLEDVEEALFDKVVAVNLKGPFRLTARIGADMVRRGAGGAIVNVSSVAALRPEPAFLPYAAAKAGLNALTEGFARALAPSVRVNAIVCGPFATDIAEHWTPEARAAVEASVALGRVGAPEEVVGAAVYLAGDASSYVTGTLLRVDGGAA